METHTNAAQPETATLSFSVVHIDAGGETHAQMEARMDATKGLIAVPDGNTFETNPSPLGGLEACPTITLPTKETWATMAKTGLQLYGLQYKVTHMILEIIKGHGENRFHYELYNWAQDCINAVAKSFGVRVTKEQIWALDPEGLDYTKGGPRWTLITSSKHSWPQPLSRVGMRMSRPRRPIATL